MVMCGVSPGVDQSDVEIVQWIDLVKVWRLVVSYMVVRCGDYSLHLSLVWVELVMVD